ncbi:hypothetical protein FACS1894137_05530 [Spirochaetia bacterium]|nr:hypothetical protein FACS1894137_05530 [Spirochaetia bacterium]
MFCPNCGSQVKDDAAFCGNCGTPAQATQPVQPQGIPVQQAAVPEQAAYRNRESALHTKKMIVRILFFLLAVYVGYYKPGGYIVYPWLPACPVFFPGSSIVGFFVLAGLGIWLPGKIGKHSK